MSEYVPFGDEWKKEVMRLKKSEIVDMLAKALRETASRPTPLAPAVATVCPEHGEPVSDLIRFACGCFVTRPAGEA